MFKINIPTSVILIIGLFSIHISSAQDLRNFKIGFSGVLSGPYAAFGNDAKNALLLASQSTKNIYIFNFQDDACDAKKSLTNIQRFIATGRPDAIILLCMEALESAAQIAKRYNIPIFSIGYISDDILNRFDNVFSLYNYADADVRYIIPYISKLKTIKTLAVIHQDTNIGEIMKESLYEKAQSSGYRVITTESVAGTTMDYAGLALRTLKNNPDGAYIHLETENLSTFIKELKRIGYKGQIFTPFTFENEQVKKDQSPLLNDVIYSYPIGGDDNSQLNREFMAKFKTEFSYDPPIYSKAIFDAMKIIDIILANCTEITIRCVNKNYLDLGQYSGIAGKVSLTKQRGAVREYGIKRYADFEFNWISN